MGATISKAGAQRATPLATATLVVAANAPDIDILSYTHGEYFALSFRRGITHGLPAMLVMPFIVTGLMLGWDRWVRRRRRPDAEPARARWLFLLAVLGLLTHPALDWMNTYGMRWLLPFDGAWSYGDALFIVDPWLWLGLGGAVFLSTSRGWSARIGWGVLALLASAVILMAPLPLSAWARRLWGLGIAAVVGAAAAGKPGSAAGRRRLAGVMGAAALVYIGGMMTADVLARRSVLSAAAAAGLNVRDLMVAPTPANPFAAVVEIRTDEHYVPGVHHWFGEPSVQLFPERSVPLRQAPAGLSPARVEGILAAAGDVPDAHYWLEWSRYPYVRVTPDGTGWKVTYRDARYDDREGVGGLSGVAVRVDGP